MFPFGFVQATAEMFSEIADGLRKVLIKGKGNRVSTYNKLYGSFAFTDKI